MSDKDLNKYIVIKTADAQNLSDEYKDKLNAVLNEVIENRVIDGKSAENKYIICNQDEKYADDIWSIILSGKTQAEQIAALQEENAKQAKMLKAIENIRWGADGDCGALTIIANGE